MDKVKKRLSTALLIMMTVVTMLFPSVQDVFATSGNGTLVRDGSTFCYTNNTPKDGAPKVGFYHVTFDGKSMPVYCTQHDVPPAGTTNVKGGTATVYMEDGVTNQTIRKILYYGWKGPAQWSGFSNTTLNTYYRYPEDAGSKTEAMGICVTSMAMNNYGGYASKTYQASGLAEFMSFINSQPNPPDTFVVFKVNHNASTQKMFAWRIEQPPKGKVKVHKSVADNAGIVKELPGAYSLAGAVYLVQNASGNTAATLTTDANGNTQSVELDPGTYTIFEQSAPAGFEIDTNKYTVTLNAGDAEHIVQSADKPTIFKPVALEKIANQDFASASNPSGDMSGAEYTVTYAPESGTGRTWVLKTVEDNGKYLAKFSNECKVSGDEFYTGEDGGVILPVGTYTVVETKAPKGYKVDPTPKVYEVKKQEPFNPPTYEEMPLQPSIGTLATDKATEDQVGSMKDRTFLDTVAYKELDKDTEYTLKGVLMDRKTGEPLKNADGKAITAEKKFTVTTDADGNDGNGYDGTVVLEFKIDNEVDLKGKDTVCFEELYYNGEKIAEEKSLENEGQTVHTPEIKTSARDGITGEHIGTAAERATVIDTVKCSNLVVSKEYTISGVLMNKATGEPIKNADGTDVTATKTFTATEKDMEVELTFTFDSRALAGTSAVAYETMTHKGVEVATHTDLSDEEQSVSYIEIGTSAVSDATGTQQGVASKEEKLTDTVAMKGLVPGKEYRVVGTLHDKTTGEAMKDENGNVITSEKTFTADKADMNVEIEFTYDSTERTGHSTIVFEDLYFGDNLVASESDLTNVAQEIDYPSVKTTAEDDATKEQIGSFGKHEIIDHVAYSGLILGKEYEVSGVLMDKATGKPLTDKDGKPYTGKTTFTVTAENSTITENGASGTVDVRFVVDSEDLAGKEAVIFENLYHEGVCIYVHGSLEDLDETIWTPGVKTVAHSASTGSNLGLPSKEETIIDIVSATNLIPQKEYTVKGVLMDKETGEAIKDKDGNKITAEKTFVADAKNMEIELSFTYDSSLRQGKTTIVFEDLYYGEIQVGSHADLEDAAQAIEYPSCSTTASLSTSKADKNLAIIKDVITYKNLDPTKTYKAHGILMDKSTGKALVVDGKTVEADAIFTPSEKDGTVEVTFRFNSKGLKGKEIVVFEQISLMTENGEGEVILTHEDISDANQTVRIPYLPGGPNTGDMNNAGASLALFGSALAMLIAAISMKRKSSEKSNK